MYTRDKIENTNLRICSLTRDGHLIVHNEDTGQYDSYQRNDRPNYPGWILVHESQEYQWVCSSNRYTDLV